MGELELKLTFLCFFCGFFSLSALFSSITFLLARRIMCVQEKTLLEMVPALREFLQGSNLGCPTVKIDLFIFTLLGIFI